MIIAPLKKQENENRLFKVSVFIVYDSYAVMILQYKYFLFKNLKQSQRLYYATCKRKLFHQTFFAKTKQTLKHSVHLKEIFSFCSYVI